MNWTIKQIAMLKNEFSDIDLDILSDRLGKTTISIRNKASRLGLRRSDIAALISRIKSHKRYTCNEKFFVKSNIINSYWAGFIAADGCIFSKRNMLCITLSEKDIDHLVRFRKDIDSNHRIRTFSSNSSYLIGGKYSEIKIYSVPNMLTDLSSVFNIHDRKTKNLLPPLDLKGDNKISYIRGLIDGDGWVFKSNKTLHVGCSGRENVLQWMSSTLSNDLGIHMPSVRRTSHGDCFQLVVSGTKANLVYARLKAIDSSYLYRKWYL